MILTYRSHELWNVQIAFFHDIASLPHTLRMTMNAVLISLPTTKYSTLHPSPFSSTFFFSILLFPPHFFIYVRVYVFPSPLLLSTKKLLRCPHSFFCKHYNFKKTHNLMQQMKTCDGYLVCFCPSTYYSLVCFLGCPPSFI